MPDKPLSLYELNLKIKETLQNNFTAPYWVIAEISEVNENRSGHCYVELVEKGDEDIIIARMRGTIWAYTYRMLKPYFETSTGQTFSPGIKVLVSAIVDYHEVYGISLNIRDIEPSYTIGELEKQKQDTIKRLEEEGVINMNKELSLPIVIQKVAIISSETAAGYEDFVNQLNNNEFGYHFYYRLFPAIMQGNEAVQSIIKALDKIYKYEDIFDIVVLIRGGGSQADLICFNDYWLAYHITQFSLPVFTGIGHERDDTVADIVAHTRLKTPTAVAEYIISHNNDFERTLIDIELEIIDLVRDILSEERQNLEFVNNQMLSKSKLLLADDKEYLSILTEKIKGSSKSYILKNHQILNSKISNFRFYVNNCLKNKKNEINNFNNEIIHTYKNSLESEKAKLKSIYNSIKLLNPENIINRGYSLTFLNSKIVKNSKDLNIGDVITTKLREGKAKSKVTDIQNE